VPQLLDGLTSAQREAVTHVDGPLLILAGPGSGKTRVVTHRIAYLVQQGVAGRNILALTFTNKAAEEMRARVERLAPGTSVWVGTFHRFCARLLRQYATLVGLEPNYTIYDADDSMRLLRRTLADLRMDALPASPDSIANAISWAKNNLIGPNEYGARPGQSFNSVVQRIYPAYQNRLGLANAVDFDDLLLHVASLLRDHPEVRSELDERYQYLLVDEYQDTNLAQYAIARALAVEYPNLAVTGDPDQSIYGWRGANLRNILEFEKDYPQVHVVRLERNYRSTKRILAVADQLIRHNVKRKAKELFTHNDDGAPVRLVTYLTHKDEAEDIASQIAQALRDGRRRPRDFAIFYRVNALSRSIELALRQQAVPYQMVRGLEFFQRQEIKDMLAYLHLVNNPRDQVALLRVINTPARGIGKSSVAKLDAQAQASHCGLFEAARSAAAIAGLSKKAIAAIGGFVAMIDRMAAARGSVEELMGLLLSETGYQQALASSDDPQDQERLANIQELLTVAREFDERLGDEGSLERFLEETSLVSDIDAWDADNDRVSLMTLHASKGLEFPSVYLIAAEEGLLPHERSRLDADQLEEERRLMFVGVTRAQQELQISTAQYRDFRGQRKMTIPSQFLMELPRGEMELHEAEPEVPSWDEPGYDAPRRAPEPTTPQRPAGIRLTTAADLAGEPKPPGISPDLFAQGMLVCHPQYGLGRIVALSGSGPARRATVDFPAPAGRMKFVLSKSPLRPVRTASDTNRA